MRATRFQDTLYEAAARKHLQQSVMRNRFLALTGYRHSGAVTLIPTHRGIHGAINPWHTAHHCTV